MMVAGSTETVGAEQELRGRTGGCVGGSLWEKTGSDRLETDEYGERISSGGGEISVEK